MFSGSLQQMNLGEVIKLLTSTNQSGRLVILDSQEQGLGSISIQLGQILGADAGNVKGLDALNYFCRLTQGTFKFESGVFGEDKSLSVYPATKLIEKIQEKVNELSALQKATPQHHHVPIYLQGKDISKVQASPDDLAVLLYCNGTNTVLNVAAQLGRSVESVSTTLAKFAMAGAMEFHLPAGGAAPASPAAVPPQTTATPPPSSPPTPGLASQGGSSTSGQVRYWRGRPIS
jgi:hypothetical protein